MSDWGPVISTIMAVIAMLFGFAKWFVNWAEKRDLEQEHHVNLRLDRHKEEFEQLHARINCHEKNLQETREKILSDYVTHEHIEVMRSEMRDDFKGIYEKLGGIDRAVNQVIGIVRGQSRHD